MTEDIAGTPPRWTIDGNTFSINESAIGGDGSLQGQTNELRYTMILNSAPTNGATATITANSSNFSITIFCAGIPTTMISRNCILSLSTDGDDALADEDALDDTITISHTVTSNDLAYNDIDIGTVIVKIIEDEAGIDVSTPTGGITATENGGTSSFDVSLMSPPTKQATVGISNSEGEGSALIFSVVNLTAVAVGSRVDAAFSGAPPSTRYLLDGQTIAHSMEGTIQKKLPIYLRSLANGTTDWKQILSNSSFTLPLNATAGGSANPSSDLAVWGSGDYNRHSSKNGDFRWKGDVFGLQLGIDKRVRNDLLVGGMVSYSKGDIDYTVAGDEEGEFKQQMTSAHPYLAWTDGETSLWGSAGYGSGKLEIKQGDFANSNDTNLLSLAGGAKKRLPTPGLSIKGDVSLARINIKESSDSAIIKQTINSQRLRLLLEAERQPIARTNGVLTPVLEIGVRYDAGSGNNGFGAVFFGASVNYTNSNGLTVQGKANATLGQNKYTEWGVQGTIRLQPGADGQGLSISLSPSYGSADGSAKRLWQQDTIHVDNDQDHSARMETRVGYGLFLSGRGLLTPYGEMTVGNYNRYALGMCWQPNSRFDLNLLGEHAADNLILLESRIRF